MFNTVSCMIFLVRGKKCLLMIMLNNQCWKLEKSYDQINLLYYLSVFAQLLKNTSLIIQLTEVTTKKGKILMEDSKGLSILWFSAFATNCDFRCHTLYILRIFKELLLLQWPCHSSCKFIWKKKYSSFIWTSCDTVLLDNLISRLICAGFCLITMPHKFLLFSSKEISLPSLK